MGKNARGMKWLYGELPELEAKEIITPEAASKIRGYYGEIPVKDTRALVLAIFSVLGAILVGSGIILIIAHNWDGIPRNIKTLLAFLPLIISTVISGYVLLNGKESPAWKEAAAVFSGLSAAACIALISQIYNMGGNLHDYLTICLLLAILPIYVFNSSVLAAIYLLALIPWTFNAPNLYGHPDITIMITYFAFIAATTPHFLSMLFNKEFSFRYPWLGWVRSIVLVITIGMVFNHLDINIIIYSICFGFFYIVGLRFEDFSGPFLKRPINTSAILVLMFLMYAMSFQDFWDHIDFDMKYKYFLIIPGIFFIAFLSVSAKMIKEKKLDIIQSMVISFPLAVVLFWILILCFPSWDILESLPYLYFNIFIAALGILSILRGFRRGVLLDMNVGIVVLSMLIIVRFFDSHLSFVAKGSVFIFLGTASLMANWYFCKRLKKEKA